MAEANDVYIFMTVPSFKAIRYADGFLYALKLVNVVVASVSGVETVFMVF
ncbi:MAG: hypothetical protein QXT53_03805 [Ignisphaera sp.]